MNKNLYLIPLFILSALLIIGCNSNNNSNPTISVSVTPQKYFIDKLAGEWLDVNVMVPPGASPATYEPTPKQMTKLSDSKLYFRVGHIGFEKAWMEKLQSVNPGMNIIDVSEGLSLIMEEESCSGHSNHEHGHHHHHGYNPHIWLSPKLVKHQVKIMGEKLQASFPQHQKEIVENQNTLLHSIDSLHKVLSTEFSTMHQKAFIVYHPVWTYLAKEYGLEQVALEYNGKEASADKLKTVVDFAKEKDIHLIFIQKEFSDEQAKSVANEIDGKVISMDPLGYNWFKTINSFKEALVTLNQQ
jgi:zinc transport system substrate-binding protein